MLPSQHSPIDVLRQNGPLLWLYLPVFTVKVLSLYYEAVACLVQKSQIQSGQYFHKEPNVISVPYTKQVNWLFQNDSCQFLSAIFG